MSRGASLQPGDSLAMPVEPLSPTRQVRTFLYPHLPHATPSDMQSLLLQNKLPILHVGTSVVSVFAQAVLSDHPNTNACFACLKVCDAQTTHSGHPVNSRQSSSWSSNLLGILEQGHHR